MRDYLYRLHRLDMKMCLYCGRRLVDRYPYIHSFDVECPKALEARGDIGGVRIDEVAVVQVPDSIGTTGRAAGTGRVTNDGGGGTAQGGAEIRRQSHCLRAKVRPADLGRAAVVLGDQQRSLTRRKRDVTSVSTEFTPSDRSRGCRGHQRNLLEKLPALLLSTD